MPKLSEFFGIAIYMYWGDHGPPHFHARYGGKKASRNETLDPIEPLK